MARTCAPDSFSIEPAWLSQLLKQLVNRHPLAFERQGKRRNGTNKCDARLNLHVLGDRTEGVHSDLQRRKADTLQNPFGLGDLIMKTLIWVYVVNSAPRRKRGYRRWDRLVQQSERLVALNQIVWLL